MSSSFGDSRHRWQVKSGWLLTTWQALHNNGTCNWNVMRTFRAGCNSRTVVDSGLVHLFDQNAWGNWQSLTRTMSDYQDKFLVLLGRINALSIQQQISIFTSGLTDLLKTNVELQNPYISWMIQFQLGKNAQSANWRPQRWQQEGKRACASTATNGSRGALVTNAFFTLK